MLFKEFLVTAMNKHGNHLTQGTLVVYDEETCDSYAIFIGCITLVFSTPAIV